MAQAVLYAYTAIYIGRVHELFGFLAALRIVLLLGLTTIILALLTPPRTKHPLLVQREVRVVLALTVLALLLIPFSVWPGSSARFLADYYSRVVLFFLLIVALATSRRIIDNLVCSALIGVGLLATFTIRSTAVLESFLGTSGIKRAYASSTYDPNDIALMMVCTLPLAAFAAGGLHGFRRFVAICVAPICVLAAIMTVSRGGFIGLVFVCVVLLFRLGTLGLVPRILILGTVVALLAQATPPRYWQVMSTIWAPTGEGYVESGIFSRLDLWTQGLSLFGQNPFGIGIGTYEVAEGLSHGGRGGWSAAHNSFIQLATELGLVGLSLFLALLVLTLRNARLALRAAREDPRLRQLHWTAAAVETSLYAYMVVAFALSQAYSPILYFLVALGAALRIQVERHRSLESKLKGPCRTSRLNMPSTILTTTNPGIL